ncbi:MAG: RIP metalloprotease RseP [Clostridia bacterium]|nr:RIP metalloprotease RseP [Clostridia bacterium]
MNFLYILLALVILLVMITVHEFGHYIAGKILGFKINEFAIGFGPALFKRKKKDGEIFSIRALPLGGFCAFEGEDEEGKGEDGKPNPEAFNNKPGWKRLIVLLSGVTFNFLFGVLTAAIYLMVTGFSVPVISGSVDSTEKTGSGLKSGDIVIAVDGKTIEAYRNFTSLLEDYGKDETFTITVERDGKVIDVESAKHEYGAFYYVYDASYFDGKLFDSTGAAIEMGDFLTNIMSQSTESETTENAGKCESLKAYLSTVYKDKEHTISYGSDEEFAKLVEGKYFTYVKSGVSMGISFSYIAGDYGFFEAILKAWPFCIYLCGMILSALGGLFTGATALKDMGGTVTAVSQIAEISQMGMSYLLLLLPLLAMNLAVFNVLPVPSLDGARAVFVIIEMIRRKPINRKIEGWIHTIGLFILLGLVIFFDVYHFAFASCLLLL